VQPPEQRFVRVGHGGASGVVRGNTPESFDAALELGVDAIEFDVRGWDGALVLAHTIFHAGSRPCTRLEGALGHLAQPRFADVELVVDVKHNGFEGALIDALRSRRLLQRAMVTSQVRGVLDRLRAIEPGVRTGVSVGGRLARRSQRWRDWRAEALDALHRGRYDALMANHRLVDARLADEVRARGGLLFAWTLRDGAALRAVRRRGVDGIVAADPRLFV
jgi:glycerophosphoryl diester phosphodiesterase